LKSSYAKVCCEKDKNSANGIGHLKYPETGSKQEKQVFKKLQDKLRSHFDMVFSDRQRLAQ
jgi:hypothetical protein